MNTKAVTSAALGVLIIVALGIIGFQYRQIQRLRTESAETGERLKTLQDEEEQVAATTNPGGTSEDQNSKDRRELMRLRAEVARLSQASGKTDGGTTPQNPELKIQRTGDAAIDRLFESLNRQPLPEEQAIITKVSTKEQDLKSWWEALTAYAQNHGGLTPNNISELQSYLPAGFQGAIDVSGFTIEKGVALSSLPENQVIYKEPNPLALSDGVVCNVWLFANGRIDLFQ